MRIAILDPDTYSDATQDPDTYPHIYVVWQFMNSIDHIIEFATLNEFKDVRVLEVDLRSYKMLKHRWGNSLQSRSPISSRDPGIPGSRIASVDENKQSSS
jgi:hypothetical protein